MIGVQLFTVREHCKTPEALRQTLLELHAMGYKRFELSRIQFNQEEMQVLKLLKAELNIMYTACQIPMPKIEKNFDWLMTFSKELGIDSIEVSVIPTISFLKKEKGLTELAEALNRLGERTRAHQIQLLYHHHHYELIQLSGRLGLDLLIEKTNPNLVNFVADTYWLARSGISPEFYIQKNRERIKGVHLRDSMQYFTLSGFKFKDCTLGKGTIDFSFVKRLEGMFLSVEEATNQPFVALQESISYLKKIEQE